MGTIVRLHEDPWISFETKYALVWNKPKIGQHQIIHHQMCDLCYPNPQSNQSQTSRTSPKRRSMMISKCWKVWAWLNSLKEAPLRDHDKITIDYQLIMHPVSGEDHVTPWRSINLDRKGKYAPVWHRCMVDRKIGWSQIIYHQICNPDHPYAQLNQVQTSKRRL